MKILITYCSAGAGHRRVAEALFGEFSLRIKETKIIDALDYTNFFFKFIYTQGYHFLSIYLPKLWKFFFYLCENRYLSLPIDFFRFCVNRLNSKRFCRFLMEQNPEIIISTHFFVNEVTSYLKKKKLIKSYLVSVITDFFVHRFWIKKEIDLYITGLEETKKNLIKEGISEAKILALGIPVNRKFYIPQNKEILCQRLGIEKDIFTVSIVTGTFGFGRILEIINFLQDDIQIIVICGKNKRLYRRLIKKGYRLTKVYGLVENMDEFMSVSDLIITKPGGSTISEALVKNLPMIFISIIPGQEDKNAEIMQRLGIGFIPKDTKDLERIIFCLKENFDQLNRIKEKIKEISKKFFPGEQIFNEICKGSYSYSY